MILARKGIRQPLEARPASPFQRLESCFSVGVIRQAFDFLNFSIF
jgi:hypothetical protein